MAEDKFSMLFQRVRQEWFSVSPPGFRVEIHAKTLQIMKHIFLLFFVYIK